MNEFKLKLIWEGQSLNEEALKESKEDVFLFNAIRSTENKIVYSKQNFRKLFLKNIMYAVIVVILFYLFLDNIGVHFAERFAKVFFIGFFITFLGLLIHLYTLPKNIIIDMDTKYFINRILKENFMGISIKMLDLEYPEKINRMVISKGLKKNYITFRTEHGDSIPRKFPIIVIDDDSQSSTEVLKILTRFVENAGHDINIAHLGLKKQ